MSRHALLVAVGEYEDPRLNALRAPQQDVTRLAAVLEDSAIGGFDSVRVLIDATDDTIRRELESTLTSRAPEDLVLVYFSCHGIVTPQRRLFFAASNSVQDRPAGTAVARTYLNELFEDCRAAARVLLLDCCFSGAYGKGIKAALGGAVLDDERVGEGYVVLTASNAFEYAFEEDELSGEAPHASVFTDVMLEGLTSGEADLNGDGWIDVRELFDYVHREVTARRRHQTPKFFAHAADAMIPIARAGRAKTAASDTVKATYTPEQILVSRGFTAAAKPICRTLGPFGRRAVVSGERGRYEELVETSAIADAFRARDPRDELGARHVRDLVHLVHRNAGDGAATAVVVAQRLIMNLLDAMRAGAGPAQLMRSLEEARALVIDYLDDRKVELTDWSQAAHLATSASGSLEVGALLGNAVRMAGVHAMIVVSVNERLGVRFGLHHGARFVGSGYLTGRLLTDKVRKLLEFDHPRVLVCRSGIRFQDALRSVSLKVIGDQRHLVVVAPDVSDEVLALFPDDRIMNVRSRFVAMRAPEDGEQLVALANAVGAELADADSAVAIDPRVLGEATKVVLSEHDGIVVVDNAQTGWTETVLVTVGALDEANLADQRRQVERAVSVVSAAAREGITEGGGATLFWAKNRLDHANPAHVALGDALEQPLRQIAANAGFELDALGEQTGGFDAHDGVFIEGFGPDAVIESVGVLRVVVDSAVQTAQRFLRLG
ncbi:TCP-1/cpn60 chaperonin family protein [Streptomyces sp. ID05-26A]|nr:TCP-1/cpn60 chaperonin family protein [Streptomyces sp. ID05-26A]